MLIFYNKRCPPSPVILVLVGVRNMDWQLQYKDEQSGVPFCMNFINKLQYTNLIIISKRLGYPISRVFLNIVFYFSTCAKIKGFSKFINEIFVRCTFQLNHDKTIFTPNQINRSDCWGPNTFLDTKFSETDFIEPFPYNHYPRNQSSRS